MYQDKEPHNNRMEMKPVKKDLPGCWGINAATRNATNAILHQGRYRQTATLNNAIRIKEITNFIHEFKNLKIEEHFRF
jgi:hypothetical protein